MDAKKLEEEGMNEVVPPQVEHVDQVPQDSEGFQGDQVAPQDDTIPNLEGGIEVLEMSNREIREGLVAIA